MQHGPGLRGPGGSLMGDMGPTCSLVGPSSRFAPAATQGGFRATGSRPLLPLESQQDDEAYQLSQQPQYGSQQHQMKQQQPGSQLLHTQGSASMDWENPSGNRQTQGTPMTQQGLGASSMLAAGCAGQQQRMGPSTASLDATQATTVTAPTQQHPQLDPVAVWNHHNPRGPAAGKPPGAVAAPAGAMQTPRVAAKDPAHAAGSAADLAALASTPAAPCAPQAGAAADDAAAAAAQLTPQQQQLLSRITSLEEHCCSMKDIVNRDIPLLLQQQAESSKQLQELTAAASSNSDSNNTLQAQLQNLTSSVASFMAEFKHWQEQHAARSTTVLSHAECQTTPGLAAGVQDASRAQQSTVSDSLPPSTTGAAAAAAAPDSTKPAGRGCAASQPKKTQSDKQSSMRSGSLMDLLFSQPQPAAAAAAVSTERAGLPAHEPKAVLSPSGVRYQRSKGTPTAAQDGHAAHGLQMDAAGAGEGHSPFVSMLAAAPPGHHFGTVPESTPSKQQQDSLGSPEAATAAAAAIEEPARKPAAKRKAAAGGRKGRGKKGAAAKPQDDDTSDPPAPAAAARGMRQSARTAIPAGAAATKPSRQSARVQKARQQQKGSSGGLTQSKLPFQRTTRAVAAAAAAVGVSPSTESAPGIEKGTADVQQPPKAGAAAAAAGEAGAEPSLKRQRVSSAVSNVAAEGAGKRLEADGLGVAAAGHWLLGDPQQLAAEDEQQQQQPLISFSRQNRQSQQQQRQQPAAASSPAVGNPNGALPAAVQPAEGFVNKAFIQQPQRPSAGNKPPGAPSGMAAGSKGAAAFGRAAPAAASGAGQQSGRHSSLIAAMGGVMGGKRDRSGNVLATTAAAAAGAAAHPAASSGLREGQTGMGGRRASASAAAGAYRPHVAATSSAMMLFGDVDDDGDSLDNIVQQHKDISRAATVPSAAAAAAGSGKGPRGGLLGRAAGLPVPPASAAKAQPPPPAAGSELGFRGQHAPCLPPMAPSGLPPHPALSAAARYEFDADSGDDNDSDTEHSLDQLPGHRPQQQLQQQRLVDDDELAQHIAARMARHRSKQRRAMSWQGGSAVGGGQSGFSVGCRLR